VTIIGSTSSRERNRSTRTEESIVVSTILRTAAIVITQTTIITRTIIMTRTRTYDLRSSRDYP